MLSTSDALDLLKTARVATLGTVAADGHPHLVPIVFAFDGADLVFAVDSKPKTGRRLARLSNIRRDHHVSVLAHNYAENWDELWWVRVDGIATIADAGPSFDGALAALRSKYPQYESARIDGPAILIQIDHVNGWRAAGS